MITKVIAAIVILVITAVISKIVKKVLSKALLKVKALHRPGGEGENLADSLGTIASLLIWLFGLMAVLNLFQLTSVMTPLQGMLNTFLGALPHIIGAALVFFVGFVLAKIAREIITTALQAAGIDRHLAKFTNNSAATTSVASKKRNKNTEGATAISDPSAESVARGGNSSSMSISSVIGQVVFAIILLVVSISALQMLGIKAISDPATHMLQMILDALPLILGACILLALGVVIAKFVGNLLLTILRGMNIESAASKLGMDTAKVDLPNIITRVVQIAIVLFFTVAATNLLGFPELTNMFSTILALGGKVLFGAVIIVAGVFIANLLASFLEGKTAQLVKIATIVLFAAMGLKYMGIADSIINLAFAALVIGGAAAAALAFGLGGRDAAARQLSKMQNENEKTNV